jgi:hypothetical protein
MSAANKYQDATFSKSDENTQVDTAPNWSSSIIYRNRSR